MRQDDSEPKGGTYDRLEIDDFLNEPTVERQAEKITVANEQCHNYVAEKLYECIHI